MGCCTALNKDSDELEALAQGEREITFKKYSSSNDSIFEKIEKSNNLLLYVSLIEYINILDQYSLQNATLPFQGAFRTKFSREDEFLNQRICREELLSMIENKIFKIKELYEIENKNKEIQGIFKANILEIYDSLLLKLNQNYGSQDQTRITKLNLIPLGLLFCKSNNISKVKLFFSLFKDESGNFCKGERLDEFLISSFIISSYSMISARKKITNSYPQISAISKDDLIKCLNVSELKDSQNLIRVFNNTFFSEKQSYNWDEFKKKFDGINGFGWLFSSKGIRYQLEQNNVE